MDHPEKEKTVLGVRVVQTIALKGVKKMMAERLLKSHLTAAEVPVVMREIDVTELIDFRENVLKKSPRWEEARVSFTHLLMKGISYALKQQPLLNSALIENEIVIFEEINIGFAVALEGAALIVPVITDVDKKSIWEIAQEGNELAERARLGKLKLEEVSKGTFTLTNAGMLGIDVACGIINQPQTAILTTGRFIEKPAFHKGNIVPRSFMSATISYDHRVLSGEPVGYFLQALSKVLENPGNFDGFV